MFKIISFTKKVSNDCVYPIAASDSLVSRRINLELHIFVLRFLPRYKFLFPILQPNENVETVLNSQLSVRESSSINKGYIFLSSMTKYPPEMVPDDC